MMSRVVLLVVLRRGTDQVLVTSGREPKLPSRLLTHGRCYDDTVELLARELLLPATIRWGYAVGHLAASLPAEARCRMEARLYFARGSVGGLAQVRWLDRSSLCDVRTRPVIPDLDAVIDGYVEGWIPDGPHTLE
jgi:hypothetical protein